MLSEVYLKSTPAREHYYHVDAHEVNRKHMLEALVTNFEPLTVNKTNDGIYSNYREEGSQQLTLFERLGLINFNK